MCQLTGITVLVTRLRGMHETRVYGHFVRQGTQAADYIMTLHWHPVLPEKRVLTIARNLRGPIGAQWHLRYFPDGRYLPIICPPEDHVRPAKTAPQTWTSDEVIQHQHESVMELIREKIGDGMVPCEELLKYIVEEKGVSERMYRKALGKLRYERLRQGNHWVYTSPRRADMHLQELDQARLHAMKLDQECFEEAKARFLERRQPPADVIDKTVEPEPITKVTSPGAPQQLTRKAAG